MTSHDHIVPMLMRHEGTGPVKDGRLMPYQDTAGKWTIGYGRNITDRGLSEEEAQYLLENDLGLVRKELDQALPWWRETPDTVQVVLMNLGYNLGVLTPPETAKLLTFTRTLDLLKSGRYAEAADNLTKTKWHTDVKGRALELEAMLREPVET